MQRLTELFAIADSGGGVKAEPPIENKSLTTDQLMNLMGEDDEETEKLDIEDEPKKTTKEASDKDDSDTDDDSDSEKSTAKKVKEELDLDEQDLEEPKEEDLELVTPVRGREILAKYPNLWKDFPSLKNAYYREQQFTELLPTIDDARVAVDKSATLDSFERDLINGDSENILKSVKNGNEASFHKLVDNYLPTLQRVDEKAYYHVLGNIIKETIVAMVSEGKRTDNDVLANAATIVNQFVFGTSDFTPATPLARPEDNTKNQEIERIESERRAWRRERFETTRDELASKIDNTLKATIDANIDPRGSMTDYVKKNAVREALETLQEKIRTDTRFRQILNKHWQRAFQSEFSKPSIDGIKSAYLSQAKTLLPSVIKKARNEALQGLGKRAETEDEPSKKGPIAAGKSTTSSSSSSGKSLKDQARAIPANVSTRDWLMQD